MPSPIPTTVRVLTRDEITRLLAASRDHPDEPWLFTALATGLRRGELLALQWQDIDLEQGTLVVHRTMDGAGKFGEPKTGRREFALPLFLIPILQEHRRGQNEVKQQAADVWQESDLIFPDPLGGSLDAVHLRNALSEVAARAGVPPLHFHALRHTACSLMLEAGIPLVVVQAILGIHRVALPLARLSPLSLAMLREAMVKLDSLFRPLLPLDQSREPEQQSPYLNASDH